MNWQKLLVTGALAGSLALVSPAALAAGAAELVAAGDKAYSAGDFQQAGQAYEQALAEDAGLAAAYNGRGRVLCRQGRNEEALAAFAQALQLDGNNPLFYACRSTAYRNLQKYELELADLQQALSLAPQDIVLQTNAIRALADLHRLDEAVPLADKLLAMYQNKTYTCTLLPAMQPAQLSGILTMLASVYYNCSRPDYDKVLQTSGLALKEYAQNPVACLLRYKVFQAQGETDKAEEAKQKFLALGGSEAQLK